MRSKVLKGSCFCGAVELRVTGDPVAMGYCHCVSCRHWAAAPVNAYTMWVPDAVEVTKGQENIVTYNKTEKSDRKFCKTCGGHILTNFTPISLIDVYAAVIPDLEFKPTRHVFYEERVINIKDGLPKFKDLPEEAGGSGEMLEE